jgi:hypothetical protein
MQAEGLREPYEMQLHAMHPARPAYAEGRLDMREARGIYRFYANLEKRNEKKVLDEKTNADEKVREMEWNQS